VTRSPIQIDPLHSEQPLIVYIDYKSPYAFIAKDATYQIASQLGIDVDWRPFTLDIPSYLGSAKLDKDDKVVEQKRSPKQWSGVKYSYKDARRYAALLGYTLRGTVKIWDSSLAGIGLLWAKQQGHDALKRYNDRMYERFWRRELDIEDPSVIESVLREAELETNGFAAYLAGPGRTLHDEIQQQAFDAGIFGVPTYIVEEEMFFGREHLPMVRWILQGRQGRAPDVTYQHFAEGDA